jgi:3-hydroxyacyl-CoA dehydrogenase
MPYNIQRAAVIGAGIMGAGIAALLANVGIPVTLLDVVPADAKESADRAARNRLAQTGLERALKAKPASAFFTPKNAQLITIGNVEDDLALVSDADWIVEAVFEQADVKRDLYQRIEPLRKPGSIISSNTSGLPAVLLLEGRSDDFRRHFLVTHFFNPVRFLKLLELVAGPDTDPELMAFMGTFGTERLGKGVVYCKDRPNFIGNRIGIYGTMATLKRMLDEGYTIEEVDAIFGPAMGRPKSAIFRTLDLAGIDTSLHVADNLYENLPNDPQRELFRMPQFVREMVARGWVGNKAGQGFYKRVKTEGGKDQYLVIDPATLEYRPQGDTKFASLDAARRFDDPFARIKAVLAGDDRAAKLAWELTADTSLYTATIADEIASDIVYIDNAMRWGFNFDAGPFETWDALGVAATVERMRAEGRAIPPLVERVLASGGSFYRTTPAQTREYFDFTSGQYNTVPGAGPRLMVAERRAAGKVVKENGSASLIDLGDEVLGVEFHTKMNSVDDELTAMLRAGVDEAQANWRALVIGSDAANFSAGANVFAVLLGARMGQWDMVDQAISALQQTNQLLKYSAVPVVAATVGYTLGGGCEIAMHAQHVRAAAETYIGLVEVGIGLIPAGGGCKEMLVRWQKGVEGGPFAPSRHVFEILAMATVATSAPDAVQYRFLRKTDAVTLDRDRLLADAKADALALAEKKARGEWQPPEPATFRLPGPGGRLVLEQQVENLRLAGKISEHDMVVAGQLARVLTGGDASPLDVLTEQDVLDLEREAFLHLLGTEKTQERIEVFLRTGRPPRN